METEQTADGDDPGFAPRDLTDKRSPGDWATRYHGAQGWICLEAGYLLFLLFASLILIFLAWNGNLASWLDVAAAKRGVFAKASYVWFGGLMGGTTFAMKWLYHTVAKETWHLDRRWWRLFMPHLSAALALTALALLTSNVIGIFDQHTLREPPALFGLAFLAGYFSDNTIAALARLAEQYLGESHALRERPENRDG